MSEKKKKSPVFLFLGGFILIIIVMFISNQQSEVAGELSMPFNEGIRAMSGYDGKIFAVASDGKYFIWDWERLDDKPLTGFASSDQAYLLKSGVVASLKKDRSTHVVISDPKGAKTDKKITVGSGPAMAYLSVNRSRNTVIATLIKEKSSEGKISYEIFSIDIKNSKASRVITLSDKSDWPLTDFAVSDDGKYFAGIGEQDHKSRLILVDLKARRKVYDNTYDKPEYFGSVTFSRDSKAVFAGGNDGEIHKYSVATGQAMGKTQGEVQAKTGHKAVPIQYIAVSPDDQLVAFTRLGSVRVWDSNLTKQIFTAGGHKLAGALTFSPDSSLVATSDMRQGGKIKVWRLPEK